MTDLITQPYLTAALGDYELSPAATASLPSLTTAASRLIRAWCNRQFTRQTFDELYAVGRGETLVLNQYPVNQVLRLSTSPTAVLAVAQLDRATNQRATAQLATTGDVAAGLVVAGVTITRVASGVATAASFPLNLSATIQALAIAINAYGQGWKATPSPGYELWPSADFRAVQGVSPAMGPAGATFKQHVQDLPFELADAHDGIVSIGDCNAADDPWSSPSWGPTLDTSFGDTTLAGEPGSVRVIYDAGFDIVPEAVQIACVELVKAMGDRLRTDANLQSETDGVYSWSARQAVGALPDPVAQSLSLYRNNRA